LCDSIAKSFSEVHLMGFITARRAVLRVAATLAIAGMTCSFALPSFAQDKKKKKDKEPPKVENSSASPVVPLSDEQQIDYMISEVMGAWQIGDSDRMRKNYADDVSVVNGGWAPPILGWPNYETLYKQQRAKMQQVRMDRSNTYIKVNGGSAWACFQWEFSAVMDGTPTAARGQTTYVMMKKDGHWVIAHDHTSVVQTVQAPAGATQQGGAPPKP
jgi:ketosteroid isomerase-like protein